MYISSSKGVASPFAAPFNRLNATRERVFNKIPTVFSNTPKSLLLAMV